MTTRTLDSKGRLSLGSEFANRLVIVDDSDSTRIVITPATAVPTHEVWLYKNDAALKSVLLGLRQARGSEFVNNPPDVDADCEDN
ncbi:MAG TPA: hypothetical protein VGM76_03960 [Lacipirellulaceae bacterium]|jgi:hypothetical protein